MLIKEEVLKETVELWNNLPQYQQQLARINTGNTEMLKALPIIISKIAIDLTQQKMIEDEIKFLELLHAKFMGNVLHAEIIRLLEGKIIELDELKSQVDKGEKLCQ